MATGGLGGKMRDTAALRITVFQSREAASRAAATHVASKLSETLTRNGSASLMVSGGTSPVAMFEALQSASLDWARVTIGLVDERWLAPVDPGANERLVRTHLLQGPASEATFLPMITDARSAEVAASDRAEAYAPFCAPVSVLVLGMGIDGHTASWFPGSPSLSSALAPPLGAAVVAVDAAGCAGAGVYPTRLTLTGPAVLGASAALLLVFGEDRLDVLEEAMEAPATERPVRHAIDGLGARLQIFWAP